MCSLLINGQIITVNENRNLMDVLRNDCHLKSVKDGCSENACGSCTVLVDGLPVKVCLQKVSRFVGKSILTVEGLSKWEKEVYVYAFGEAGAVQCGFCIPGMVMSAKALLDVNLNPNRKEIANALRNNICRCTGYKKIIDAVELAAKIFREKILNLNQLETVGVGQSIHRIDVQEKVLGEGTYVDDLEFEDMIYGSAVRSSYARARVLSIDTSKALALDGVRAVLTAEDIPGVNRIGHMKKDWDTLIEIGGITKYLGDAICLVAANSLEVLEQAKKLIQIEYEPLPAVFDPLEALSENAPLVHLSGNVMAHEHLVRGDIHKALENSAYVVTRTYQTPFTEHAFMERECAVAIADQRERKVLIYSTDQSPYATQRACATVLGLEREQVCVINKLIGGAFGGKEDMTVQHHAALLSWHVGVPVKVKLTRQESILIHPKRHPAIMEFTTGCDKNGILTGMKAKVIIDTGAYASLGQPVLMTLCTHAAGPYNYQNIDIDGTAVYTNNPPAGAFRGFGATQSCFATECNINLLAEMVGISQWEIRYRNAIRPGQELPNGQLAGQEVALVETLEAVKEVYESNPFVGIACAMKNVGVGLGYPDIGRCKLNVVNGKLYIHVGAPCIGQGMGTVMLQIACKTTGLNISNLIFVNGRTNLLPNTGGTSASKQTLVTGEAVRRACEKIAMDLKACSLEELNGREYLGEYLAATDGMHSLKKNPMYNVAYAFATHVVLLDENGVVKKIVAAHDVGRAINPLAVEGQIDGGVIMSMGYALTEDYKLLNGMPNVRFCSLGLLKSNEIPDVESIIIEKNQNDLAFGALGIGEITTVPTAPAIQGAYYQLDHKFRTILPLVETAYTK